jgi:microcystin-dependent protein
MRFPLPETGEPDYARAWPVGSVFVSAVDANPAALLGFGTWAAFAAGRVLVGLDAGQAEFDTLGGTGGAKTVTLTAAQSGLPAHGHAVTDPGHAHVQGVNSATTGGTSGYTPDTSTNTRVNSGYSTSPATTGVTVGDAAAADAAEAHSNMPPYVCVRMWLRTA